MKTLFAAIILTFSTACSDNLEVGPTSAANAKATEAAPATTSIDPLAANFDADKAAPAAAPDTGHEHHHHDQAAASAAPTGPEAKTPAAAHGSAKPPASKPAPAAQYTCPHHPEVISDKPGECPKCHMDLVPKKPEGTQQAPQGHDHGAHQ